MISIIIVMMAVSIETAVIVIVAILVNGVVILIKIRAVVMSTSPSSS